MKIPKVSICCLAYNHEKYIQECLEGFMMQKTDFDFEVLIHDDASTDATADIIREYEARFPGIIKPIYQVKNQYSQNIKPTFSYNFPRAQGKYIAMCEGDDYWTDPLKLQKQIDFLEKNLDYSFSMGRVDKLIEKTGKIIRRKELIDPEKEDYFTLRDYLKDMFSQTSSFVFRNENMNFPDWISKVHAGDQSIVIVKTGINGKIKYHSDCFSIYRVHSQSVTSTSSANTIDKLTETMALWNDYLDYKYDRILRLRILKERSMWKIRGYTNRFKRKISAEIVLNSYNIIVRFL